MKLLVSIVFLFSTSLYAHSKYCVLFYPKQCKPILTTELIINCPEENRKLKTNFSLTELFETVYLPPKIVFKEHNLDYFVWNCYN